MPIRKTPKARRTQQERSALTRGRILDATLDCLAELGYASTTTTVVAARARVSRGAQLHHFPTRHALIAAAVQHLYASLTESYQKAFARLSPEVDRVDAAIDLLWEIYCDPRLVAVLELYVAARTDAPLRAALLPIAARHHANVVRLAREYFPEVAATNPRFDLLLDVVLETLQGLKVRTLLDPNDPGVPRILGVAKEIAAAMLTAPYRSGT